MVEEINSYVWKSGKELDFTGKFIQTSKKLVLMNSEELNNCYEHCKTMLFNSDIKNLGRYKVLELIADQKDKCGVELFLRYLESSQDISRLHLVTLINNFKNANKTIKNGAIDIMFSNIPKEYGDLSIQLLLDGCIDRLGIFNKKHITKAFIFKQGIWLTSSESKELGLLNENNSKNKLAVIRNILNIKDTENLYINAKGINYTQLRSMLNLRSIKKYSELTTDQLTTLRYKILTTLEGVVMTHINSWERRMSEIEEVAEHNNIILSGDITV